MPHFHIVLQIADRSNNCKKNSTILELPPIYRDILYPKQGFITADSFPHHNYTQTNLLAFHISNLSFRASHVQWNLFSLLLPHYYYHYKYPHHTSKSLNVRVFTHFVVPDSTAIIHILFYSVSCS